MPHRNPPIKTVQDLIDQLSVYDRKAKVCMSRDPEGNGFHEVHEVAKDEATGIIVVWPLDAHVPELE